MPLCVCAGGGGGGGGDFRVWGGFVYVYVYMPRVFVIVYFDWHRMVLTTFYYLSS